MKEILVLNDVHLGVARVAGTTMKSAAELREYLQISLCELMMSNTECNIVINGDLFDEFVVPMHDMLGFFYTANQWLESNGNTLVLGRGNHDYSKDSSRLSSLDTIGRILTAQYGDRVKLVTTPEMIFPGIYMIPHVPNQELLDLALAQVPDEARIVLLHANYDNNFTAQSDHSLNVTARQAIKLLEPRADRRLVFGHEHQARTALSEKVILTGNQWPSSIADCQSNPHGRKLAHIITPVDIRGFHTWEASTAFQDIAWEDIELGIRDEAQFIRVSGNAKAEQASEVIARISQVRGKCGAFVISNAVRIEGIPELAELPASLEMTKAFDVFGFLLEQLSPEQVEVVLRVMEIKTETA